MRISITALLFLSAPALAHPLGCADVADNRERLTCYDQMVEAVTQCIKHDDKLDRLTCFDDLAKATNSAPRLSQDAAPKPSVATTAAAPPVASAEEGFGLQQRPVAEPDEIQARVASLSKNPYGQWTATLDNGQRWRQADGRKFRLRAGDQVLIKKAALGSFLLSKVDGSSSARVKRLD